MWLLFQENEVNGCLSLQKQKISFIYRWRLHGERVGVAQNADDVGAAGDEPHVESGNPCDGFPTM